MTDRLKNLGCVVSDKNLVIYAVSGLDSRFAKLVEIIRHREPLPTFETARNMLLLKESSMNDQSSASITFESSSSSPTIPVATNSSNNKGNPNTHSTKSQSLPQLCNHFNKGTCKFGDHCKFIHDHRNRAGLTSKPNTSTPSYVGQNTTNYNSYPTTSWTPPGSYQARLAQHAPQHAMYSAHHQPQHGSLGLLGPAPALYPSQPTYLPSSFSTMTLPDPT
ncbi:hybrid signal transduction histidine kinase M [Tanacetum coccineum]